MASARLPPTFAGLVCCTPHIFAQAVQDLQAPRVVAAAPDASGGPCVSLNCCLLGGMSHRYR